LAALVQSKKRKYDRTDNHKANLKVSDILGLISNKCNFFSDQLLSQTKKMLFGISQYIETFEAASIY